MTESISIIMATARENYPIIGFPDTHFLKNTIESLKIQKFKDFEFIIVDALYNKRPNLFKGDPFYNSKLPFRVKHVPLHKNHRFWVDRHRWGVAGQLNTGIIYSCGELIIRIDDCCEFDSKFLNKFWDGYQCGYFPGAMHIRYDPVDFNHVDRDGVLNEIYKKDGLIRDQRYEIVNKYGGRIVGPHNWHYGYSSMSLEAALKINGYDENFDADKSLEDVDCGSRIEMAGFKDRFLMDVDHQVIEYNHSDITGLTGTKATKCNYALYLLNRKKRRFRANSDKFTGDDIRFIIDTSRSVPCTPEGEKDAYDENLIGTMFETWMFQQPIFDLKYERKIVIGNE